MTASRTAVCRPIASAQARPAVAPLAARAWPWWPAWAGAALAAGAPNPASQGASPSGIAERVGGGIAPLQPDLVGACLAEVDQEALVELDAAVRVGVDPGQPALQPGRVELVVPGRVERVRHVDAPAVAADLDHLRPAGQRALLRVRGAAHDPAELDRPGVARLERVGDVVLAKLASPPAGHVEEPV